MIKLSKHICDMHSLDWGLFISIYNPEVKKSVTAIANDLAPVLGDLRAFDELRPDEFHELLARVESGAFSRREMNNLQDSIQRCRDELARVQEEEVRAKKQLANIRKEAEEEEQKAKKEYERLLADGKKERERILEEARNEGIKLTAKLTKEARELKKKA